MTGNRWLLTGWLVAMAVILVLLLVSRADFEDLRADYDASQEQNTSLSGQLQLAQSDLSQLQSDYDTLSSELAAIKEVYPPRDFSSVGELKNWLKENDVSELPPIGYDVELMYSRALKIQADALKDGYIISVDFDAPIYVACVAIINGNFWWWYPDTDEPNLYSAMGKVSRD